MRRLNPGIGTIDTAIIMQFMDSSVIYVAAAEADLGPRYNPFAFLKVLLTKRTGMEGSAGSTT